MLITVRPALMEYVYKVISADYDNLIPLFKRPYNLNALRQRTTLMHYAKVLP